MKIGILGSSFNPIHNGHLHIARQAHRLVGLEKVLLIPSNRAPHKDQPDLLPADLRLEMVRVAVEDDPSLVVSDVEICRGGKSYTVDTLKELHQLQPGDEFYFLIGSDMVPTLHTWKDIRTIFKLCRFLVFQRPECPVDWEQVEKHLPVQVETLKEGVIIAPPIDVSSSEVRRRWKEGRGVEDLVPSVVERLLHERGKL